MSIAYVFILAEPCLKHVLREILQDAPVEQPTKVELAINLKTGKLIAISLPSSLVAHSDEVIE